MNKSRIIKEFGSVVKYCKDDDVFLVAALNTDGVPDTDDHGEPDWGELSCVYTQKEVDILNKTFGTDKTVADFVRR